MRRSTHAAAFSLLELVTVIAIVAVMAAVALPRYGNSLASYRAAAAAQRVAADVNFARARARLSSQGQTVVFDAVANAYTLPGVAGLTGQPSPYTVRLAAEPYAATVVSNSFASTPLAFDRYGQPSAGGTLVLRSGTATRSVVVDAASGLAVSQ